MGGRENAKEDQEEAFDPAAQQDDMAEPDLALLDEEAQLSDAEEEASHHSKV